jgi:hypothetical protein
MAACARARAVAHQVDALANRGGPAALLGSRRLASFAARSAI